MIPPPPPRILADLAPLFAGILLDTAAKSTALLLFACAAAFLARRASAATRHLLWAATLASLLLLPLLSWTLPAWHILPLPTWARIEPTAAPAPLSPSATPPVLTPPLITTPPLPDPTNPPFILPTLTPIPTTPTLAPPPQPPPSPPSIENQKSKIENPPQLLLRLYALGTTLLLLPLLLSFLYLRHLARRATPLPEPWPALLLRLQSRLALRRPISLKQSSRRTAPMTFGILRPTILLPKNAWPDQRRQIVLLHELAHIRRHDCLTQLLARLVRALFWFHPLVWLATARLALEAERACDDLVLSAGTRSSDYASELLSLASSFNPPHSPHPALTSSALTMARPSTLETRLRAILDATRNRRALTTSTIAVALASALGIAAFVSCMRPAEHTPTHDMTAPSARLSIDITADSLEPLAATADGTQPMLFKNARLILGDNGMTVRSDQCIIQSPPQKLAEPDTVVAQPISATFSGHVVATSNTATTATQTVEPWQLEVAGTLTLAFEAKTIHATGGFELHRGAYTIKGRTLDVNLNSSGQVVKSEDTSSSASASPPVLLTITWHANPAGQFSMTDTRTLILTDPADLQRLAACFPGMDQDKPSTSAATWLPFADFTFTRADGTTTRLSANPQLTSWSQGHGGRPVQGNLAAQLAALPWPQPAGTIAWGPALQGIQLGIRVPQPRYAFGDPLAPELWARNLTDQPLTFQYIGGTRSFADPSITFDFREEPAWTADIFSPHADGAGDITFRSSAGRIPGNPVPTITPLPPHQEIKLRTLAPVTLVDPTQPSSGRMNLLAATGRHALWADWSQEFPPGPFPRWTTWTTGKTEIEIAAPPVIAATQTDLMPEIGANFTLFPNDIYKTDVPGPAEMDNSRAWTMANEFVYRTALRKRYKLPASSSGKQGDGYVVGFDAVDGTGTLHVLVSQNFTRVTSQGEWGNMIDGVQAQLLATGKGPDTRLTAAVRNDGSRTLLEIGETQRFCELQVDGQWYRWDAATAGGKLLPFGSGVQLDDIAVSLGGQWKKKEEGEPYALWGSGFATRANAEPLTLTPGKHKVRIAFFALPSRANTGNLVRAQSNLVEVATGRAATSRPAATAPATTAAAEAPWGDPVNGMQLRLTPAKSMWNLRLGMDIAAEPGTEFFFGKKDPILKLEVRNLTEKAMGVNLESFALECDGKLYHPLVGTKMLATEVEPRGTAVIDLPLVAFVMPPLDGNVHKLRAIQTVEGPNKAASNLITLQVFAYGDGDITTRAAAAETAHDLAALRSALKPPSGWTLQSREDTLAPHGLSPAHGIELSFPPTTPPAGKFIPLTLWIMDPDYPATPAPPSTQPSTPAAPPHELPRWNNHRVFLQDNYDKAWPHAVADIQQALAATNRAPAASNSTSTRTAPNSQPSVTAPHIDIQVLNADGTPAPGIQAFASIFWMHDYAAHVELAAARTRLGLPAVPLESAVIRIDGSPFPNGIGGGRRYVTDAQGHFSLDLKRSTAAPPEDEVIQIQVLAQYADQSRAGILQLETTTLDPTLPPPQQLRLAPAASAEFTILSSQGQPLPDAQPDFYFHIGQSDWTVFQDNLAHFKIFQPTFANLGQGKFRADGLVSGVTYHLLAAPRKARTLEELTLTPSPGEKITGKALHLIAQPAPATTSAAASRPADYVATSRGRVVQRASGEITLFQGAAFTTFPAELQPQLKPFLDQFVAVDCLHTYRDGGTVMMPRAGRIIRIDKITPIAATPAKLPVEIAIQPAQPAFRAGEPITYTVTFTNHGPAATLLLYAAMTSLCQDYKGVDYLTLDPENLYDQPHPYGIATLERKQTLAPDQKLSFTYTSTRRIPPGTYQLVYCVSVSADGFDYQSEIQTLTILPPSATLLDHLPPFANPLISLITPLPPLTNSPLLPSPATPAGIVPVGGTLTTRPIVFQPQPTANPLISVTTPLPPLTANPLSPSATSIRGSDVESIASALKPQRSGSFQRYQNSIGWVPDSPQRIIEVTLDDAKLKAAGLTADDIRRALETRQLHSLPSQVDAGRTTLLFAPASDMAELSIHDLEMLPLQTAGRLPLHVSDVATLAPQGWLPTLPLAPMAVPSIAVVRTASLAPKWPQVKEPEIMALCAALKPPAGWTIDTRQAVFSPKGLVPAIGLAITLSSPDSRTSLSLWIVEGNYSPDPNPRTMVVYPNSPTPPKELDPWNGYRVFLEDNTGRPWPDAERLLQEALHATDASQHILTPAPTSQPAPVPSTPSTTKP